MTATTAALHIRRLDPDGEDPKIYTALARLFADAYPLLKVTTDEDLARTVERIQRFARDPGTADVVAERDGALVGVMRLFDYRMNVRGTDAPTGGVGSVAVSLAHKRQGIARAMLAWYLEDYRRRGAPFAVLHPFKLDFYRAIGFGYGTPVHRFRFAPATLRDAGARGTARFLDERDCDALVACYERVRAGTNGLIAKHRAVTERMLTDAALRYVGVEDGGTLRAFMQTTAAAAGDRLRNADELTVRDLAYEDEASLAALLGYLRAQRDQFARVAIESQDAAFYLVSDDPRDGSELSVGPPAGHRVAETGLGPMYRMLDVPRRARAPAALAPAVHAARRGRRSVLRADAWRMDVPLRTVRPAAAAARRRARARRDARDRNRRSLRSRHGFAATARPRFAAACDAHAREPARPDRRGLPHRPAAAVHNALLAT